MSQSVDLYGTAYGNFATEVLEQVRRDTYGEDFGQSSWVTGDESIASSTSPGRTPARAAAEPGATSDATTPALRSSHRAPSSTSSVVARCTMFAMPMPRSSSAVAIGRIERGHSRQLGEVDEVRGGLRESSIRKTAETPNSANVIPRVTSGTGT